MRLAESQTLVFGRIMQIKSLRCSTIMNNILGFEWQVLSFFVRARAQPIHKVKAAPITKIESLAASSECKQVFI